MSSITVNDNNNTNTSTSRRGKKGGKISATLNVEVANEEVIVNEAINETTSNEVVDLSSVPDESDIDSAPTPRLTEVAKAPTVNFWKEKMRQDAESAVQKAKAALEAAEVAQLATEKAISSKSHSSDDANGDANGDANTNANNEGWETQNKRNRPFKGKPFKQFKNTEGHSSQPAKQYKNTENHAKPSSAQDGQPKQFKKYDGQPKQFKDSDGQPKQFDGQPKQYKPRDHKYVPKEPTEEQVAYRARKTAALELAQKVMIQECVNALPSYAIENINSQLRFVINFSKTLIVDVSQDIPIQHDGETFQFSRERFMENRFFQNHVRDAFASIVPDGWLRFSPSTRTEGTYCISIRLRRN